MSPRAAGPDARPGSLHKTRKVRVSPGRGGPTTHGHISPLPPARSPPRSPAASPPGAGRSASHPPPSAGAPAGRVLITNEHRRPHDTLRPAAAPAPAPPAAAPGRGGPGRRGRYPQPRPRRAGDARARRCCSARGERTAPGAAVPGNGGGGCRRQRRPRPPPRTQRRAPPRPPRSAAAPLRTFDLRLVVGDDLFVLLELALR